MCLIETDCSNYSVSLVPVSHCFTVVLKPYLVDMGSSQQLQVHEHLNVIQITVSMLITVTSLEHHSISNYQQLECLFSSLFRLTELHVQAFCNQVVVALQMCTSLDVLPLDIPFEYWIEHVTFGPFYVMFRFSTSIFDKGSSRLCNWLSLWCLVPGINHLPPVCWSAFSKSSFKW